MGDDEPKPDKKRCYRSLQVRVKWITESNSFNAGIMITIFLNAVFIALETYEQVKAALGDMFFTVFDNMFLTIYSVEFVLKIYAEPKNYWRSAYNWFDFIVLVLSYVQVVIYISLPANVEADSRLGTFRIFRALRTLRAFRTVSFVRGLQVLVTALLDTLKEWLINILLLLLMLMFLFAIMGYYFFGCYDEGDTQNWGSLASAMLTLFSYVTVDGWTEKQERLDAISTWSRLYTILAIFMGHFIFTNIFVGVIIINISEATDRNKWQQLEERQATLRHKKEYMMARQHKEVIDLCERSRHGKYRNFAEMAEEFRAGLEHGECFVMGDLCTNLIWIETYMLTLEHTESSLFKIQQLHFEMANTLAHAVEERLRKRYGT